MLFKLLFLTFIFSASLFSQTILQKTYYIDGKNIKLSNLVKSPKKDKILFNINPEKHTKKIKKIKILEILQENGYSASYPHSYIKFIERSPVDTTKIKQLIKQYYRNFYPAIHILHVTVQPRAFTTSLPIFKSLKFKNRAYLSSKGIAALKSENKEIYFNYKVDALLDIYIAREDIKRHSPLSQTNIQKKQLPFVSFRSFPLQNIQSNTLQAKYNIKKEQIISKRNTLAVYYVKRGSTVNVSLKNSNIDITFSAKAKENGRLSDIITVQDLKGKIFKAKVVAKNKAEIE